MDSLACEYGGCDGLTVDGTDGTSSCFFTDITVASPLLAERLQAVPVVAYAVRCREADDCCGADPARLPQM
jgi:hypothetical protein